MSMALQAAKNPHQVGLGYAAALAAVAFTSIYPAVTRVTVTTTLTPADLLMLRFGLCGLLFVPYLFWKATEIPKRLWSVGIALSFFHGWGMVGFVIFGLQFAPASHSAALGPGTISAWIAMLGFALYGINIQRTKAIAIATIIGGVALLLMGSVGGLSTARALTGDVLFLAAAASGAVYLVYVQQHRLDPILGVALVSAYSTLILLPWYLLFATSSVATASAAEIAWQVVFQGLLMGCGVFLAINYAVLTIGSQAAGMLFALTPVLGLLSSLAITDDPVSPLEWAAIAMISTGVAFGARPARAMMPPSRANGAGSIGDLRALCRTSPGLVGGARRRPDEKHRHVVL
jgi:drug/metabolite transporter (DMT)-like permease